MKQASWQRRLLRAFGLFVITPYLVVTLGFVLGQRKLLFQPTRTARLLANAASSGGTVIEDVEIPAENGLILHGWRFRAEPADDHEFRFLVIYFPGNAGCRADRLADAGDLTRLGCDVLLFDYRGYGDNAGSPSETTITADARRIWTFATEELEVPPSRIVIFGESLGGAVAVRLASEQSQIGALPAAAILNSTFDSLADVIAWHYPLFPFRFLLWDDFDSVKHMPAVACPVLQFHGTDDDIVPFANGRRLFSAVNSQSGLEHEFITIPGGQHNFITVSMMQAEIQTLLDSAVE